MKFNFVKILLIMAMLGISFSSYAYYGQSYNQHMANTWLYFTGHEGDCAYLTDQRDPDVAVVKGTGTYAGYFVLVWRSQWQYGDQNGGPATDWDIYARRYKPDATPIDAAEVSVATIPIVSQQMNSSVAANINGDIVIVWHCQSKVYYRQWSFGGGFGPQMIATTQTGCYLPDVGISDTGEFVLTWYSNFGGTHDVWAKLFDASGLPMTNYPAALQVSTTNLETETEPQCKMIGNGDFVIAWQHNIGGNWGVEARKYYWIGGLGSAGGLNNYGIINVNTFNPNDQTEPDVGMDGSGRFIITYQSYNQPTGSKWDVWARRYDTNATPLDANEWRVNTFTQNDQTNPDVDTDYNGYSVITWQSKDINQGDPAWGIRAAEIKPYGLGTFQTAEFQVNNVTSYNQTYPVVSVLRAHNYGGPNNLFYVIAWEDDKLWFDCGSDAPPGCAMPDIYFKIYDQEDDNAITLEKFTAAAERDKVVLNWTTGTEIDNLGYFIVRSTDLESNYELVNTKIISSTSNGTSGSEYTFNDVNVNPGTIYYYWLISVDVNGVYNLYGPVSIITYIRAR